jgi:hypothetical protein
VKLVVKENPLLEGEFLRQNIGGMAIGPQAAGVIDLGVGFGTVFFGHKLDDGIDSLELDPESLPCLGWVVTGHAGYLVVLGGLPGIIIRLHDVATVAKGGGGGVIKQIDEDGQKSARDDGQHFVKLRTEMEVDADPLQKSFDSVLFSCLFHSAAPFLSLSSSLPWAREFRSDGIGNNPLGPFRGGILGILPFSAQYPRAFPYWNDTFHRASPC